MTSAPVAHDLVRWEGSVVGRAESRKDLLQVAVESGAVRVGRIAQVVTSAVAEITREIGGWATDVFEMREAARRAQLDSDQRHVGRRAGD